jgi:hypothetical protein
VTTSRAFAVMVIAVCGALAAALSASIALASTPSHGRAWELVTPSDPIAATIYNAPVISADGTGVVYVSLGSTPGAPAGDLLGTTLAIRGPSGWMSSPLGAPYSTEAFSFSTLLAALPLAFSENLETSLWLGNVPLVSGGPPEGHAGLYRISPGGMVAFLADMGEGESGKFIAASQDVSHAVFSSEDHLLPADSGRLTGRSIYVVDGSTLSLVDQDNNGTLLSACGSAVSASGGVSQSGKRIFFTNPDPPSATCATPSQVYMRESGSATVDISASDCTRADCNGAQDVHFAGATPTGSSVFLTTTQQLTNSDTDQRRDLYRYDVESGLLAQISTGPDEATGEVTDGVTFPSADGSSVYFYANGRLLPGEGSMSGENLYLDDGDGLHFVAPVGASDPLQVSQNGRVALLATSVPLEPADTDGHKDVYLYDANSRMFTRLSKGPDGGNGNFDADISSPIESIGIGLDPADRALTDDGSQAFFSTDEQLLPEDVNNAADVYEWADGSLGLISSGTGSANAKFAGASADGDTVLFKTSESLLPSDRDGGDSDLYAARASGGFSTEGPPLQCGAACAPPRPEMPAVTPRSSGYTSKRTRRHLSVRFIQSRAGMRLVSGRRLGVIIWTPIAGRISAKAKTRIGDRAVTAASGTAGALRTGAVRIWLRATSLGRRMLRRHKLLRVHLEFSQSDLRLTRDFTLRQGS